MNCEGTLGAAVWLVTTTMVLVHFCTLSQAQYAKSSYYMNSLSDCHIAGFWVMRSDDVVHIFSRRPGSTTSDLSDCAIRLKLDDARDILDVTMSEMQINDRDVVLTVDLSGGGTWTLTGGSTNPGKMTSKGGQVTISLTRLYKDQDNDYYFSLIVRAYTEESPTEPEVHISTEAVEGIIGAILAGFVILSASICVGLWLFRRRSGQGRDRFSNTESVPPTEGEETGVPGENPRRLALRRQEPSRNDNSPRLPADVAMDQVDDDNYYPNDVLPPLQSPDEGRVNSGADFYEISATIAGGGLGSHEANTDRSNYDSLNPADQGRRNEYERLQ